MKSGLDPIHRSAILSFTGKNVKELHQKLFKNRIICSFREGSLRITPHFYNTESEIYRLIEILEQNTSKSLA